MVEDEPKPQPEEPPPWRDSLRSARAAGQRDGEEGASAGLLARLGGVRPILAWGLGAGVLVVFAAVLLYLYTRGEAVREPVAVSADKAERRVKPAQGPNEAGLPQAEVYDALRKESGEKAAGSPQAGAPAAQPSAQAAATPKAEATTAQPKAAAQATRGATVEAPGPEGAAPPAAAKKSAPAAPGSGRPADTPEALSAEEQAEQGRALSGSYAVQVAAFVMRWRAESFVAKAAFDYREALSGLSAAIVPAEKDGRTFWRVRYGPFYDRASAEARCRQIRAAKLNCIVVRVP